MDCNCFEDEEHISAKCFYFDFLRKYLQQEILKCNPEAESKYAFDLNFCLIIHIVPLCLQSLCTRFGSHAVVDVNKKIP